MPRDFSTKCELKKQFMVGDRREWRWIEVLVSKVIGAPSHTVHCAHCHGKARIHRQQIADGPQDHVEHLARQDSENCRAGIYFEGAHKLSSAPVE